MKKVIYAARESTKKFNREFRKSISSAIVAAFGLITALAWKDVIEEYLSKVTGLSPVEGKIISALIVTIIAVLAIMIITRETVEPIKEIKENED